MNEQLVLGIDAGGTSTRAVIATVAGRVVGRGKAGPGNPVARPPALAAAALAEAVGQALHGVAGAAADPAAVVAATVGMAGVSGLRHHETAQAYDAAWTRLGLRCPMRSYGDAVVAFAAGTPARDGTVLIAGTGAVAAEITGWRITRTADGMGWLLGDEGSGFWLGLAAARSVARQLYAGRPAGPLTRLLTGHFGTTDPDTLVTLVYQVPRDEIAALAPLVSQAGHEGDPAARAIHHDAADRLVATLTELGPGEGPLVLAGGVFAAATDLREAVRRRLSERHGRTAVQAGDGAAAAAWLAAREVHHLGDTAAAALHQRLVPRPG